jgi:hypothetical protein
MDGVVTLTGALPKYPQVIGPGDRGGVARCQDCGLQTGSPAIGFQPTLHPTGDAGGHDPEAQHGASRINLPQARGGGRVDRRHGEVSLAVPAAVPGIAFLSGGQSGELASARLNAMNVRFKSRLPWSLTSSFVRAIQQPALEIFQGGEAYVVAVQKALDHRARCQPVCAPRRIQCSHGKEMSTTTSIQHLTKTAA